MTDTRVGTGRQGRLPTDFPQQQQQPGTDSSPGIPPDVVAEYMKLIWEQRSSHPGTPQAGEGSEAAAQQPQQPKASSSSTGLESEALRDLEAGTRDQPGGSTMRGHLRGEGGEGGEHEEHAGVADEGADEDDELYSQRPLAELRSPGLKRQTPSRSEGAQRGRGRGRGGRGRPKLSAEDRGTPTISTGAALVASQLLTLFVQEAVGRSAEDAQLEGSSTIRAPHLERVLPKLLLDF